VRSIKLYVVTSVVACGRTALDVPDVPDAAIAAPSPPPECHDWHLPAGAACSPSPTPTVLFDEKVASFQAFAVDDANVYWTDVISNTQIVQTLHAVSKCGGPSSVLATGFGLEARPIFVHGGFVWGFGLDGLLRVPVKGGAVEHLGEPGQLGRVADDFAIDETTMFTAVQDLGASSLVAYSLADRLTQVLAPCSDPYFARFAVDCATVFFTVGSGGNYRTQLASVAKAGGPVSVLTAPIPDGNGGWELPGPIAMDNDALYWARLDSKLLRVKKDGSDVRILVTNVPAVVAVDDANVYFLFREWNAVARVPKLGGTPESVVSTGRVSALALDATDVFWAEAYNLEGYRIAKIDK